MKISKLMPLRSNAGWYAGRVYTCNQDFPGSEHNHHNFRDGDIHGDLIRGFPYSRESDYFKSSDAVMDWLQNGNADLMDIQSETLSFV